MRETATAFTRFTDVLTAAEFAGPLAIMPEAMHRIEGGLAELAAREERPTPEEVQGRIRGATPEQRATRGGVLVMPLFGFISQRSPFFGTATERFGAEFDRAIADDSIAGIVIEADSPGGSVSGVEELSQKIFDARGTKPIVSVVNSLMASAAYYIGSAADEVVATPSSLVGAIGTILIHVGFARMLADAGIDVTVIRAGRFKGEGNPFEELGEEAEAHLQEVVDEYYDLFTAAVARNLGTTQDAVRGGYGQARALPARQALDVGLVSRIATIEDVLEEMGVGRGDFAAARAARPAPATEAATEGEAPARIAATVDFGGFDPTLAHHRIHVSAENHRFGVRTGEPADTTPRQDTTETQARAETDGAPPERKTDEAPQPTEPAPAAEHEEAQMAPKSETTPESGVPKDGGGGAAVASAGEDRGRQHTRTVAIAQICGALGATHRITKFVESGMTPEQVGATLADEANEQLQAMSAPMVDLSEQEVRRYSVARAILASADKDWGNAPFELEVHEEISKNLPAGYKPRGGVFIPTRTRDPRMRLEPVSIQRLQQLVTSAGLPASTQTRLMSQIDQMRPRAALDTGTATEGQELVFTEAGSFIDLLRNKMMVAQLGATTLFGLQGPVSFPKQDAAAAFQWVGEEPAAPQTPSQLGLTQVALNPKSGQATTAYTRQLLTQGIVDIDMLVKNDLALITALGIDLAAINGGGGDAPTGILGTTGVNIVPIAANGGQPTWANVVDLESVVATDNADIATQALLTTPGVRGLLKTTEKAASTGQFIWMNGEVNGYRAEVSNQVPSTLTKGTGTNLHAAIHGVWSQLMLGYWGAYELIADPFTRKTSAIIEVTSFQMAGVALRYPEAFAAFTDVALV